MPDAPLGGDLHLHALIDHLGHDLDPSILIGGWATYELVGGEISKDIDLIIFSDEVRAKIEERVTDLSKSSHLQGQKWRGTIEGVHLDIYLPHQSQLGDKLRLRVEVLAKYVEPAAHKGWRLLTIEAHTVTKLAAILDRPDSLKGQKDAGELLRLIKRGVDARSACDVLVDATAGPIEDVPEYIERAFLLIAEKSGANKADRRMLDRLRREWVDAAQDAVRVDERVLPSFD
ncbi:nucleotidyl transferase AbiEii/AbiGii toxin family protein [Herbiconiux sp. P18]|uniref:hypothetical protein n=1 Tax=Herbiconiux liangxiaofengii TaxID=3342795 RepID=UPI0035B9BF30